MVAVSADKVIVELEARLDRYNAQVAGAQRHFDKNMEGIRGSAARTELAVTRGMRNIAGAIGIVGTLALARGLLSIADEAKNLEAQLRLATAQTGNFGVATDDVRRIAAETRTSLSDVATLYGTFQRNAHELGITQEQAARATETITKAFQISGATAAEAAGGIRQFLQGIQSGTLRGEELNSVLENAPRLARALADGLGVTIGQLRAMGAEGQITGAAVVSALEGAAKQIDAEFKQLPVTFDQAMTQVHNAAVITFGAFDRGGQFSNALANFITQGTGGFVELEQSAVDFGISARGNIEGLADVFEPLADAGAAVFDFLSVKSEETGINIRRDIQKSLDDIDALVNRLQFVRPGEFSIAGALGFPKGGSDLGGTFRRSSEASDRRLRREEVAQRVQERFGTLDEFLNPKSRTPPARTPAGSPPRRRAPSGGRGRATPKAKRQPTPAELRDKATFDMDLPPALAGADQALVTLDQIEARFSDIDGLLAQIGPLPDLSKILPIEEQERIERFAENFASSMSSAFEDAIIEGNVKDAFSGLLEDLARLILRLTVIEPLARRVAGAVGSIGAGSGGTDIVSIIGSAIGNLFGGARAAGGPVNRGKYYLVGENGPELFAPDRSGSIIPQGRAISAMSGPAAMSRPQITVISAPQFDLRHAVTTPQLVNEMHRVSKAHADNAAAAMGKSVLKAVPGRLSQFSTDGT